MTLGDSMEEEDDERSESHSWKVQMSKKIDVQMSTMNFEDKSIHGDELITIK